MTELENILREVRGGAGGAGTIANRTGLDRDTVEAALAALAAAGLIRRVLVFADGCTGSGCTGCQVSQGCGSAGVGSLVGSGLTAWRET
jgi:hypothetical protein